MYFVTCILMYNMYTRTHYTRCKQPVMTQTHIKTYLTISIFLITYVMQRLNRSEYSNMVKNFIILVLRFQGNLLYLSTIFILNSTSWLHVTMKHIQNEDEIGYETRGDSSTLEENYQTQCFVKLLFFKQYKILFINCC